MFDATAVRPLQRIAAHRGSMAKAKRRATPQKRAAIARRQRKSSRAPQTHSRTGKLYAVLCISLEGLQPAVCCVATCKASSIRARERHIARPTGALLALMQAHDLRRSADAAGWVSTCCCLSAIGCLKGDFWLFSMIANAPSYTTGRCRTREARLSATYLCPMHAASGHDRIKAGYVHWLMLDLVPFSSLFLLARTPNM
jgi:hypothetical protein